VLVTWQRLGATRNLPLRLDLGIQLRTSSIGPTLSALLDHIMDLLRKRPSTASVVKKLESFLQHASNDQRDELGIGSLCKQALRELGECTAEGLLAEVNTVPVGAPDALWHAIAKGSSATVEAIIAQGGLTSGCAQNLQGNSVLWDALAHKSPQIAAIILRCFPPDSSHGVDVAEIDRKNGNSLLHIVSGFANFPPIATEVFRILFNSMPQALRPLRNSSGQNFVHIAAWRMNLWILKFAASNGLSEHFTVADIGGWTPRGLIMQGLESRRIAEGLQQEEHTEIIMPSWCSFGQLQPREVGERPAFADVMLVVEDENQGRVRIFAHCVVLSASSKVFRQGLAQSRESATGDESRKMSTIRIDPKCCRNGDVVLFAIRFLYTCSTECNFSQDGMLLAQLVFFCVRYSLPASLARWSLFTLLPTLSHDEVGESLMQLLLSLQVTSTHLQQDAQPEELQLRLPPVIRQYIARRFFLNNSAWANNKSSAFVGALQVALSEFEPLFPCFGDQAG